MIAKFHILDSITKVRLYPRECKAEVGLKSLQQYLLVVSNAAESSRPTMTAQLPLPHMSERLLKTCERAVSVEKPGLGRLERREVRGCGNMRTNSGQKESFKQF